MSIEIDYHIQNMVTRRTHHDTECPGEFVHVEGQTTYVNDVKKHLHSCSFCKEQEWFTLKYPIYFTKLVKVE